MKHGCIALLLGATLSLSAISGCGASGSDSSSSAPEDDRIFGEVSSIDGDTITIEVGTQKERDGSERGEKPDKDESGGSEKPDKDESEGSEKPDIDEKERGSMLELTGEEKEITVTDDTEITRQSGRGFGGNKGQKNQGTDENDADTEEKTTEPPSDEKPEATTENISLDDISEGDTIAVTLDDDGKVAAITVISGGRNMEEPAEEESSGV